jgi:asparagine synthase (glutamine-hydrolysing)
LLFTRAFGVEARLPFFDRELVEFGTRIPARLKLEGVERTKRLFREAMEGILPDVINHRRDKLGHSVPLKNWLRGAGVLGLEVTATLRSEQFRARDMLKPEAVERLLQEHATRRDNHSHRLWGFFVLEHWLRRNID